MNSSISFLFLFSDMARPENMELIIKDSLNDKNQKSSEDKSNIKTSLCFHLVYLAVAGVS